MNSESEGTLDSESGKWRSADVKTAENVDFSALLLPDRIQLGLKNCGFEKPSPVQLQAIPFGRCGIDLVVQAKSGTGKTCVMGVIALDSLVADLPNTQVLILAPTREIASQICGVIQDLGCAFPDLTCEAFIGGLPVRSDKNKLPNCQIVVGTPGRIKQLIDMEILQTESIRLFVVDEADRLFDKQFKEDINWIFSSLPSRKQILALSATYPEELSKFLSLYMETPVYVRISSEDPALLGITQCFRATPYHPMLQVTDCGKFDVLLDILNSIPFTQCMIFCQRQTKAQDLADNLVLKGFPSLAICGSLDQVRRLEIIQELKSFQCRVLVSTDLTARGIDAENVDVVINFEIPYEAETYLHRIGRAGRYGARGMSISLASNGDELKRLKSFQKKFLLKIYELPDPIPANIWDQLMTLQALEPDKTENGSILPESKDFDNTNGLNGSAEQGNSICGNKPHHLSLINHNNTVSDVSGGNFPNAASNGGVEANEVGALNGYVLLDNLEKTEEIINETQQLISDENETEKTCETEVSNTCCSSSDDQVDYLKKGEVQNTCEGNYCSDELKKSNSDIEENASVENLTQRSTATICVPEEVSAVSSHSKIVADIAKGENNDSSVKLRESTVVDVGKEDLNSGTKPQVEEVMDDNDLIKTDSLGDMNKKESESVTEIVSIQGEEAVQSKVKSCALFKKLEKYFHGDKECVVSEKNVSDILVPLLSVNKMEDPESSLSYHELVHSWESYSDTGATYPIKHYSETSDDPSIPQAHMEVMAKYIYNDKCNFFSSVQKIFEMECNISLYARKSDGVSLDGMSACEENLGTLSASKLLSDDEQHESKSASASQNESVISCETVQHESELLENASISDPIITTKEGENSCESNPLIKKNEDAECDVTCKEPVPIMPSLSTTKLDVENGSNHKSKFLPFSVKPVHEHPSTDKNEASNSKGNYLTEAVYDSVTCGLKYSKIVSLPPISSDSAKESNSVNRNSSGSVSNSSRKPVVENQGVKKKVRGTSWKTKNKSKCQKNTLNSSQVSEPCVSITNDVVEGTDSLYQETKTMKNVTFDSTPILTGVPEQRFDRKKRGKRMSREHKNKHSSNSYGNETTSGDEYQNPFNFANSDNSYYSPCVAFAPHYVCCCRLPHVQHSGYLQSPVPFQSVSPQYYYQKFLEQWYYVQELTYSYHRR